MVAQFSRGQKSQLSAVTNGVDLYVGVLIEGPGTWDISCFGLDEADQLSDDAYFVFFNQPASPEGSIQLLGAQSGDSESFRLTLEQVPDKIHKLSICASSDDATAGQITNGYLRIVAGGEEVLRYPFTGADFSGERAVIVGDVYRKGVWRVAAVGQGFNGGLADLLKSFGGEVADEDPEPEPEPAAAPGFAPPPGDVPGFGAPPAPPAAAPGFGAPPAATSPPAPPPAPAAPAAAPPAPAAPPPPAPAASAPPPLPTAGAPGALPPDLDIPDPAQVTGQGSMAILDKYKELPTTGRWTRQSSKMLKVTLGDEVLARRGCMVAYQGDVEFQYKGSGGLRKMLESKLTGQGLQLMTCKGQGEVFLAEDACDLHVVELGGRTICVNANNVLAFDATLETEVKRIESAGLPGGGMFHLEVSGQGTIVVMTHGTPVTLPVQGPTSADINATVAWSAGMRVSVSSQVRVNRNVYAGQSAETATLDFMGMADHFVVVQPYEV